MKEPVPPEKAQNWREVVDALCSRMELTSKLGMQFCHDSESCAATAGLLRKLASVADSAITSLRETCWQIAENDLRVISLTAQLERITDASYQTLRSLPRPVCGAEALRLLQEAEDSAALVKNVARFYETRSTQSKENANDTK